MEKVKKLNFEGDWAELGAKIWLLRKSGAKYLEQNTEFQ